MIKLTPVPYYDVQLTGGFWAKKQKLDREVTIHAVYDRFADTGRIKAFEFGWKEGSEEPRPHFFWDSDVAKWMESACMLCAVQPDDELMKKVNELVSLIERHQQEDGYFNIFHTVVEPKSRFRHRDHHELYCLGHLIEAAVAYKQATGSDRLIDVVDKYIDLVIKAFVTEKTAGFTTPGHEEIELALIRLYRLTKKKKHLELAMFFLNERGKHDELDLDWCMDNYNQSHLPVREQRTAEGHAVRACYLYSAMADAAKETGDIELFNACKAIFEDITQRKMYITGGIGSSHYGEAFTVENDLPNDTAYAETCASIALYLFCERMKDIELNSAYADTAELAMYNGILSGLSLDGKAFFYENPLEINLIDRTRHTSIKNGERLPITERQEVFGCSCCPPNMTRFLAGIAGSALSYDENGIYIHQFMPLKAKVNGSSLTVETDYPESGRIRVTVQNAKGKTLFVRVPWWSKAEKTESGYNAYEVTDELFTLELDLDTTPRFFCASAGVRADAGKLALLKGPVVTCMEGADNRFDLFDFVADTSEPVKESYNSALDCTTLTVKGFLREKEESTFLYALAEKEKYTPAKAVFLPYYAFANRGESDMAVWFRGK